MKTITFPCRYRRLIMVSILGGISIGIIIGSLLTLALIVFDVGNTLHDNGLMYEADCINENIKSIQSMNYTHMLIDLKNDNTNNNYKLLECKNSVLRINEHSIWCEKEVGK